MAAPGPRGDLAGLAPATIVTAECHPLRDEGERYGAALSAAGVRTTAVRFAGQAHPFLYVSVVRPDASVGRRLVGAELGAAPAEDPHKDLE